MFVVATRYMKPLEAVDAFLAEHRAFLDKYIASGHFVAAGRQEPRTGGVILAKAKDRAEVERIMAEDPFSREGIARFEITEVVLTKVAPGFDALK